MNIKTLPADERPREKLISQGARNLTNSELLGIILNTGTKNQDVLELSNKFFKKYNLKSLSRLKITTLKKQLGIGDAKACQIIACFELGKRLSAFKEGKHPQIKNAKDIAKLFISEMNSLEKENFKGVYLDSRKRIIKQETIFIGSLNESVVHPREIFKIALDENAAAIILLHNHPSGDPNPSSFDIEITKELVKSGEFLGIQILDHIIIGGNKYFSMKEKGLLD
jgi:DNA repair protein RadC